MNYYCDIILTPHADVNLGFLWQKAFQQVHIALVDNKVGANESAIALSIVDYNAAEFPLGHTLRLFAAHEEQLMALKMEQWLQRLKDYCVVTPIKKVPMDIKKYAQFKRKPVKSIAKKAQRRAAHLHKPYAEVMAYLLAKEPSIKCTLPYIRVESQHSKKDLEPHVSPQFLLFIQQTLHDTPKTGTFDCYGLSKTATVPWFT